MQYPISASITLIQTDGDADVCAYVHYGPTGDKVQCVRMELRLGDMADAVDMQMWMQMVAASVCDAL